MSFFDKLFDVDHMWLAIGLIGQIIFGGRFVIQWLASEKKKESVIPVAFWWCSIGGGVMLLAYAIHKMDPVFILGQGLGLLIYARNLVFILKPKASQSQAGAQSETSGA